MSITWVDILVYLFCWAAMVGAVFAAIITIIVIIVRKGKWHTDQWRYAGIAFGCGFVVTFLAVPVMYYTR